MGDKVWEACIPLSSAFLRLHHLSSLKSLSMSDVLVSFSFGFRQALFNKEVTKVTPLLSLIEGFDFRSEIKDVCVWSPSLVDGISCKSFFRILVHSSPVVESSLISYKE